MGGKGREMGYSTYLFDEVDIIITSQDEVIRIL